MAKKKPQGGTLVQMDRGAIAKARQEAKALADQLFEKEMQKHLKPVTDRITGLEEERAEIESRLGEIEKELRGLTKAKNDILGIEKRQV